MRWPITLKVLRSKSGSRGAQALRDLFFSLCRASFFLLLCLCSRPAFPARVKLLDQVLRLAALTQKAGLDGVVCSSQEIAAIRAECGPDFKLIVPGIRPAGAALGDQKRVMTPKQAIAQGADYLVIGRPITGADDPAAAAAAIAAEVDA